ncbi:MAG: DUF1592 domain-containing protein [Deltaproteobacteria bacterium]|nr:DUF1592 domain-containing protein [Deltaproteobacteria bacterium]
MKKHQDKPWRKGAITIALLAATSGAGSSCTNGGIGDPGESCQSPRAYFLSDVWGPVLAQRCVSCHAPGGQAGIAGARFSLLPASYPNFADANLAAAQAMVNQSFMVGGRTVPALLAKPLGLVSHGGGSVIREGSAEHTALTGLVSRLANASSEENCRDFGSLAAPSGVVLMTLRETLRKVSLDLLGRLPTEQEYTQVEQGEDAFTTLVAGMVEDPAFYERFRVAFNDMLLTDTYVTNNGCDQRALNLISSEDFPNRGTYGGGATAGLDCCNMDRMNPMCESVRTFFRDANNAIAREPVNLFEHVVRNNRPFSELLTADYTLVNPQSAYVYNVSEQVGFNDQYADANQLRPARIQYTRRYSETRSETVAFPHAGVLTMPAFLARYPTTSTNRNRHRARMVQSFFLMTDILKVGERPIDSTAAEALIQTPTLNYGPCVTCHTLNDPIAGAFRGFYPTGTAWRYDPNDAWYADMLPPGFAGENTPGTNYRNALQWLAPRVTQDPRFAMSVVRFVYKSLTGREPLSHPTDTMDPLYGAKSASWGEQDRVFRAISRRFLATNMNFKTVVIEMVKSPLYRAIGAVLPEDPAARATTMASHEGVGAALLASPEQLDRRIRAIAGFGWFRDLNPTRLATPAGTSEDNRWLTREFYLPYGGINSDTIVRRVTDPSGIIVGVAQRMANELSCRGTAWDFTVPVTARRYFNGVELDTVPEAGGSAVPGNITRIKETIRTLHERVLGERLAIDDPEITRTYQLFLDTWREAQTPNAMGMPNNSIPYECQGRQNPATGAELPNAQRITEDRTGVIRAWMAVMTYLYSDYRFLYQ